MEGFLNRISETSLMRVDLCIDALRRLSIHSSDGYLGTIQSRTSDKFLDAMKSRLGERHYQRGVHKGERIDASDYFWPEEFQPTNGLEAELEGRRQAPLYVAYEIHPREEILPASGARLVQTLNPRRQEQLRRLAPTWRY